MGRQFAYESDSVGEQKREIVDNDLADGSIKCCKQLVFSEHLTLAKQIHKSRLTHIGISYKCHSGELATVFTLNGFLSVDRFQFLFKTRYTIEYYAAVSLDLSLTRSTHAYASTLALKVSPQSRQTWQQILVLC